MASVVPTVLAANPEQYQQMYDRARSLSLRVHIDISDGKFTDTPTLGIGQVHRDDDAELDLHLMVEDPASVLESALSLKPQLIIFHAESQGDIGQCIAHCRELGVKAGIAILPKTSVESVRELIAKVDHVLIFTGKLGYNGGEFAVDQLAKTAEIRAIKPDVEISVDGGVNDKVASLIAVQGVDVLYSGGFLQSADDPGAALTSIQDQIGAKI